MPPITRPPSTTAFAKTTRPEIANVVARETLYTRLDGASSRTVAWISGPAGCGKSTLAASYVAARNYRVAWYQVDRDDDDVETFLHFLGHAVQRIGVSAHSLPTLDATGQVDLAACGRAFFRRLFAEAGSGAAVVIDGLELGDEGGALWRCLEGGLTQVPRHCVVLVTSRQDPPPGLARLRANGDMVHVGAEDLRVTPDELQALALLRGRPLGEHDAQQLHERTQGWAAAIVLMLEHAKMTGEFARLPGPATPSVLFDYLAGEIFARFEPSAREMLLRIACLPRVTVDVAVAMTGDARVARLLLNLSHNDYFVRELVAADHRVYVLHPLHREFLLRMAARELPQAVGAQALARGARLLQGAGLVEDALPLLAQAGDWAAVAALVVEQADGLLAQGRRATVLGWIERLPPAQVESDPALLCIDAASRLADSPRAARLRFEQAWRLCRERDDPAGRRRACTGVVEAIVAEFDDLGALDGWLPELGALLALPAPTMHDAARVAWMTACWLRDPADRALARRLGEIPGDAAGDAPSTLLCRVAALLRGDYAAADVRSLAADARAIDERGHGSAQLVDALQHWLDGDADAARRTLDALDGAAPASPAHLVWRALLRAAVALACGDAAACRQALELPSGCLVSRGHRALWHVLRSELASLQHETALALREARAALHVSIEVGLPWVEALARIVSAQALGTAGDAPAAQVQILGVEALAQRLGSAPLACSAQFLRARQAFDADDEAAGAAALRQGLAALRDLGARQVIGVSTGTLAALLAQALRLGIEVDHARQVVRHLGLRPPPQAQRLRAWAWRFDLCTLGTFELLREGRPIEFSAKGPGRPLELLKVLVAYGARHVRVDELTDALWPHVDGDYAYKSFTATLHRLRRLLGDDEAVLLREGRLGLHPAMFWIDAWAFDHLVAEIDAAGDALAPAARVQALVGELVALYRGPFLPDESDQPAYLARREQLRARLLRALGQAWPAEASDSPGPGELEAYARCAQADELCEAFHRELMRAYLRRGDLSRGAAAYRHLQALLATRLHVQASPETEAIYRQLTGGAAAPP